MMRTARRSLLGAILIYCCCLFSGQSIASEERLSENQGYMLILMKLSRWERVSELVMTNVDTDQGVRIRTASFRPAGVSMWIALVPMVRGRYFWSGYEPLVGNSVDSAKNFNQMHSRYTRTAPGSTDDIFEIAPGVINYVGDWQMRIVSTRRSRLDPSVAYDNATLEKYLEHYPEIANKYEIFLSMLGKEAISLDELARLQKKQ